MFTQSLIYLLPAAVHSHNVALAFVLLHSVFHLPPPCSSRPAVPRCALLLLRLSKDGRSPVGDASTQY